MKRLGRVLGSLLAVALTVFSLQAFAAAQMGGRDFNHMTTGFILSGGHAVAACETCHIGGVFKGTPRACDGCHSTGRRIIATPKNNSHIVTDAPCENCHFNTATWLGARFNHGTAQPGQCATCHNGRLSFAKPSTHNTGNKSNHACDSCHRSSSWLPASWNHNGVTAVCSSCHISGAEVTAPNRKPASHVPPKVKGDPLIECDACHLYSGWYPNRFKHNTGGTCMSCHFNGVKAQTQPSSHSGFTPWPPTDCSECHTSTLSWLPALGAKPGNHIIYNAGIACNSCHTGGAVIRGASLHTYVSASCKTCHDSGAAVTTILGVTGRKRLGNHEGSNAGQDCTSCHARQYTKWNNP